MGSMGLECPTCLLCPLCPCDVRDFHRALHMAQSQFSSYTLRG